LGLEVTYAYDDLVFISHNAFLLRMGDKGQDVHLYFNTESDSDQRGPLEEQLRTLAAEQGLKIHNSGTYTMEPREDEQLDIHFNEITSDGVPA
jgi:hypothetical protein